MKIFRFTVVVLLISALGGCNNGEKKDEIDINKSVVINELLPKNTKSGSDQNGEFDDWIEIFNLANEDIDISGFYLSDSKKTPDKWKFPKGTILPKNGYLIVWADEDTLQSGLHSNFKLSTDGENVVLMSPEKELINLVEYPATLFEQSWARNPNGTGKFKWSQPTFNKSND